MNSILLVVTIILYYGLLLVAFKRFGKTGLFAWIIIGTVFANLEVNKLIDAFGVEMTLGNVLFSSTFLATDIMSECFSKEDSKTCVRIGVFASICMIIITNIAVLFVPSANDTINDALKTVVSNVPRICIASLGAYIIVQFFDIFMYHKIWDLTTTSKTRHDKLWMRNNGSTICSQLLNSILFNVFAFAGIFDVQTLVSVILSTFVLGLILAIFDTPFIYLARLIHEKTGNK
jgi:uncharacterized integral membrane protein (TIGR00697 family)